MGEIGCYTVDLYCDCVSPNNYGFDCPHYYGGLNNSEKQYPAQFTGRTRQECIKDARAIGWVFKRDGRVISPKCKEKKT